MKPRSKSLFRISAAMALACAGTAHAADISFSSSTPLTFTDTQSYDNGTVDRIGSGTGTVVIFDSGANYTFGGNLTLTGAWNRITLNGGASLNVAGTLSADVSGVSLNGGTLTTGALVMEDNPNWAGSLWDGKQWVEYGDSVLNGSTIVANQSNANFIRMGTTSGFSVNWFQIGSDGATIDSNGFDIGQTMNTWGGGGLTKTGAGTLSLTASNNFTGNTLVSNGILEVTTTGKLYGGGYTTGPTITVASSGTLRLNGWSWDAAGSIANLDYSRDRLVVNGGTIEYTGNSNFNPGDPGSSSRNLTIGTGGATLKASSTSGQTWTISSGNGDLVNNTGLTLDGAGAGDIKNVIQGSGSVTKTGVGTWTLSGVNTYVGTTNVNGGTLLVNGSTHADSAVTVASGATLGGTGTVGGATAIQSGGTLNAGNGGSSKETLAFGGTLGLSGTTTFDIGGDSRGTGYDGIDVTGALTNGGALSLNFTNLFANGSYTFDLFSFGSQTGTFSSVSVIGSYVATLTNNLGVWSGSDITGNTWTFTQSTGDLGFTAVPEPTSALAGLLLGAGLLRRRRPCGSHRG